MKDDGLYEKLMRASLRFISYRPRSEKEVRDFLHKKLTLWKTYAGPGMVEKIVERMRSLGYVDDEKFAAWWVDQRRTFKLKGKQFIDRELQGKGVSKNIIEQVLAGTSLELELAKQAIQKKLSLWSVLSPMDEKQKIYRYLASRGFDQEAIAGVIDEVLKKE